MRFLSTCLRPSLVSLAASTGRLQQQQQHLTNSGNNQGPAQPLLHSSFREIVDRYDAFILDQFGVMHNGVEALDGAIETVEYMYKNNKKMIILSNTSAPSANALLKLPKLGFDREFFVGAVTSGEEASRYIRMTYGNDSNHITKVVFLTWNAQIPNNPRLTALPSAFLEQCGNIQVVDSIPDADLVIIHGSEVWFRGDDKPPIDLGTFITEGNLDVVDEILKECYQHNLPCVCANPDLVVVTPTGGRAYMPGRIAHRYRELGGDCKIFGKPDAEHFEACIRKLDLPIETVCHVGDSLHHDIAGALQAGIPNVFVTSGIHASDLGVQYGDLPSATALEELFAKEGGTIPTHVVPALRL